MTAVGLSILILQCCQLAYNQRPVKFKVA